MVVGHIEQRFGGSDLSAPDGVELGLGLLSIGRRLGSQDAVPTDSGRCLLGTRWHAHPLFDTAPAYAASERRLGAFLRTLRAPGQDSSWS